jgi:hypothetical protein
MFLNTLLTGSVVIGYRVIFKVLSSASSMSISLLNITFATVITSVALFSISSISIFLLGIIFATVITSVTLFSISLIYISLLYIVFKFELSAAFIYTSYILRLNGSS